jgi:hypothetical protein
MTFPSDDKYTSLNSLTFLCGVFGEEDSQEPIWQIEYHAVYEKLLVIKGEHSL